MSFVFEAQGQGGRGHGGDGGGGRQRGGGIFCRVVGACRHGGVFPLHGQQGVLSGDHIGWLVDAHVLSPELVVVDNSRVLSRLSHGHLIVVVAVPARSFPAFTSWNPVAVSKKMFLFLHWNVLKLYDGGVVFISISPTGILSTLDQSLITLARARRSLEVTGKVRRDGFW